MIDEFHKIGYIGEQLGKLRNFDQNTSRLISQIIIKQVFYNISLLQNDYSRNSCIQSFVFTLLYINYIIQKKGLLRKIKYISLPLFASKVNI